MADALKEMEGVEKEALTQARQDELKEKLKVAMKRYQDTHNEVLTVVDIKEFVEQFELQEKIAFLSRRIAPLSQKDIVFLKTVVNELEEKVDAKKKKPSPKGRGSGVKAKPDSGA